MERPLLDLTPPRLDFLQWTCANGGLSLSYPDPDRVGAYDILARLGAGGMGVVYLAEDQSGLKVAVKVVRPELAHDEDFRRRFAREVKAAASVGGAYTAQVIDADASADQPYLVTEYIKGSNLDEFVRTNGPLDETQAKALAIALAEALAAIHDAGLTHRDVKPSNVLLGADGPRLIDFGIARAADATAITRFGMSVGTPAWMAPEQAQGKEVTPKADLFSWGSVVAFASTGRAPFGDGPSDAILYRVVHEPPDVAEVPSSLVGSVASCLEKDPSRRPTATELLRGIAGHTAGLPLPDLSEVARTVVQRTWVLQPTLRKSRRKWRNVGLVAGGVVVSLLAAGLWLTARTTPEKSTVVQNSRDSADVGVPDTEIVYPDSISASSAAPGSRDAAGNVVTYQTTNMVDGDLETAWRTRGDASGETITLEFAAPITIYSLGLVPGYSKIDPTSGVDRFRQERVITEVVYVLDGGQELHQSFRAEPTLQTLPVDGVSATSVTIEIIGTAPPGDKAFDFTAISEIQIEAESGASVATRPSEDDSSPHDLTAEDACFSTDTGVQGCFWTGAAMAQRLGVDFAGYGGDPGVFGSDRYHLCLAITSYVVDALVGNVAGVSMEGGEGIDIMVGQGVGREAAHSAYDEAVAYMSAASETSDAAAGQQVAERLMDLCSS